MVLFVLSTLATTGSAAGAIYPLVVYPQINEVIVTWYSSQAAADAVWQPLTRPTSLPPGWQLYAVGYHATFVDPSVAGHQCGYDWLYYQGAYNNPARLVTFFYCTDGFISGDDGKSAGPGSCATTAGNPCDASTGNKYQVEVDYLGADGTPSFVRYYNSRGTRLGFGWSYALSYKRLDVVDANTVRVHRVEGRAETFRNVSGTWQGDSDTSLTVGSDASGFTLTTRDGSVERYDTTGRQVSETDPSGRTTRFSFQPASSSGSLTGPFGHVLQFKFDNNNRLTSVTDPAGQIITYAYDTNQNLSRVNYPDGSAKIYHYENTSIPNYLTGISYVESNGTTTRYATYSYDTSRRASVTEHAGGVEHFGLTYNSDTQTTVTDAVGTQQVLTFATNLGVKNLLSKVNNADGKALTQTFDANNNLTCKKNEEGRVTTYTYNSTNQRTSMTEGLAGTCGSPVTTPATRTTTYQYKSATLDLPTVVTEPSVASGQSKTVTIAYGNVAHPNLPTSITQSGFTPAGGLNSRSVTLSYTVSGQLASIDGPRTDASDVTSFTYYDCTTGGSCGQLQSMTDALGHVTTYDTYDAAGRLTQMTDPNSLKTNYAYDTRGRVKIITQTPSGGTARTTTYTYNAASNVTSVTFPDGIVLTYTYNAAQQLTRVADNGGNRIDYTYDLKGNRTGASTYDPSATLVRQIQTAYDARNHVTQINNAGSLTDQIVDAIGNLTSVTDPNNNSPTQYGFDALNRLVQTLNSAGGTTTYSYDIADRVQQVTAPNNATTQYSYDDLGNLLQEISPDRATTTYTYDAAGNVTSKTDARGMVVNYTYDALNRLTGVTYPASSGENITYTYDTGTNCTLGIGRLCQVTDVSGTTQYGYDAYGNVTREQKTELGINYVTTYTYDAGNRVLSIGTPDGRTLTYTRDTLRRITGVSATVNGSSQNIVTSRTYRPDGLLLSQTYGNGLSETKQYDLQGRLTNQFLGSADTRVYGYDPNSNVTNIQSLPQVGSYTYDTLDRLTIDSITSTPTSTVNLSYDPNGNRTSDGTNTYTYTTNTNQLSQVGSNSVTLDAAGNITSDGTNTYSYNNDGHLQSVTQGTTTLGSYVYNFQRQRTQKTTNSTTTVYHYDTNGNLILETGTDGTSQVTYVYADKVPIAQISRSGGIDTVTYLHTDHEGTPRLGTNNTQAVVWRWEGRAFGDTAPTGTATVNLRYAGMYADAETGLYYNWNRYFDPKSGRYITSDPLGLAGRSNTYVYALSDPLRWFDSTGLVEEREPAEESREPTVEEHLAGGDVARLLGQIRQYDPAYRYEVARPAGTFNNRADVEYLENVLRQKQRENVCNASGTQPSPRFTPDQDALVQLAKEFKRTGISAEQAKILEEWAREYNMSFRGPETHPNRPYGSQWHVHVGPVNHIPVK